MYMVIGNQRKFHKHGACNSALLTYIPRVFNSTFSSSDNKYLRLGGNE